MRNFDKDVPLGEHHVLHHASQDHYELICRNTGRVYPIPRVGTQVFRDGSRQCPLCYDKLPKQEKL